MVTTDRTAAKSTDEGGSKASTGLAPVKKTIPIR